MYQSNKNLSVLDSRLLRIRSEVQLPPLRGEGLGWSSHHQTDQQGHVRQPRVWLQHARPQPLSPRGQVQPALHPGGVGHPLPTLCRLWEAGCLHQERRVSLDRHPHSEIRLTGLRKCVAGNVGTVIFKLYRGCNVVRSLPNYE